MDEQRALIARPKVSRETLTALEIWRITGNDFSIVAAKQNSKIGRTNPFPFSPRVRSPLSGKSKIVVIEVSL